MLIRPNKVRISKASQIKSMADEVFHWSQWFKQGSFYLYGIVYMCVRMTVNVTSVRIKKI